jgi:hypothetical protein
MVTRTRLTLTYSTLPILCEALFLVLQVSHQSVANSNILRTEKKTADIFVFLITYNGARGGAVG